MLTHSVVEVYIRPRDLEKRTKQLKRVGDKNNSWRGEEN